MLEYANNARSKPTIGSVNEEWNTNDVSNFSKCRIGNPFLGKMIDAMANECTTTSTGSKSLVDNQHVKPRFQSASLLLNHEATGINQPAQTSQRKHEIRYSQYSSGSKEITLSPKKRLENEQSSEKSDQPNLEALPIDNSRPLKSDWVKMSVEYKEKLDTVKSLVQEMDAKFKQIQENPDFEYLSSSNPVGKMQDVDNDVNAQKIQSIEDSRRMTRRAWWVDEDIEAGNE